MKIVVSVFFTFIFLTSAGQQRIDLLVYNAKVYTIDENFSSKEAMAVDNEKVIETGTTKDLLKKYDAKQKIDAHGKFVYPGLIDAHSHFVQYGLGLQNADLVGTNSWDEIIEKLKVFSEKNKSGWLLGEGWDQNDWPVKNFPNNQKLNELFPDRPVVLSRVDGHAVIANKKALDIGAIPSQAVKLKPLMAN